MADLRTSRSQKATPLPLRPDYHAVLRHEDQLGGDGDHPREERRANSSWPFLARLGAGLAVSAITTPLIYLAAQSPGYGFLTVAALGGLTGVLGAHVGYVVTRRELRAWTTRMKRRTSILLLGEEKPGPVDSSTDFVTYLDGLADSLELTLERQWKHERDTIISVITTLISALEARDPYTRNHSARVAKFAVRLGREMQLDRSALYEIHLGGLLHDIGKIGIPDSILLKPAGLTRDEYETMKSHSLLGARILSGIPGLEAVSDIVLQHHEMYNGRGYPDGLEGKDIALGARIVAVSDTYMSMVEDRPYRKGQSLSRVLKEIRRVAGHQLDPDVVDALQVLLHREVKEFGVPLEGTFTDVELDVEEAHEEAA